ncbi:MAG TPA: ABC-2 family transporter protein [Chthoniobacterales bacterium]|nr:ABC-2 family transporter protein [Chthoniobacterales bacterium]
MKQLASYLRVYGVMLRNSLVREMNFKLNFLLWMLVEVFWFAGQLIFIEVIYAHVDAIGDWTKWDMVLLVGTHQIISQIFNAFFFTNLMNLSELVRTGKLDFVLLQPIDAQFTASVRRFGIDSLINAFVGVLIVCYALKRIQVVPSFGQIALYFATVLIGVSLHYAVMFGLATVSFWSVRAQGVIYGYYNIINLARYPDVVFKGLAKFVFSWVLPVMVVTNVPARVLIHASETPWPFVGHLVLVSMMMILFSRLIWRSALNHYSSASS